MNRLQLLPIVLGIAGFIVLYGAIENKNPLDVVKLAVQGKDLAGAAPLSGSGGNTTAGPGSIPGGSLGGTPEADGDARTDPPGFDPNTDDVIPRLPGEHTPTSPPINYSRTPFPNSQYWV